MYVHAVAGFPVKETFLDAVRTGNYATWPGLTTNLVSNYFPDSNKMQKGHMNGQRKGVKSTKVKAAVEIKIKPGTEDAPPKLVGIKEMNDIFVKIYKSAETIHMDQTGAFPVTLQQGYQYIMVGSHLDANYIFCELIKNRMEGKMINTYQKMVDRMKISGLGLKHYRLDNECSENFKKCIQKNEMTHKLVPPNCHQRSMTKRAIQTFKNRFVAILSRVDDRFPLSPVVSPCTTSQIHRELIAAGQRCVKSIGVRSRARTAQLHEASVCPIGVLGDGTHQTQKPMNLGCLRRCRLQHRHGNEAP